MTDVNDVRDKMNELAIKVAELALSENPSDAEIAKMKRMMAALRALNSLYSATTRKRDKKEAADDEEVVDFTGMSARLREAEGRA